MSVIDHRGVKVDLPRSGITPFWELVHSWAGDDEQRWKRIAMLALRTECGWTMERIGRVFGHPRGHVARCLAAVRDDLRDVICRDTESERGFSNPDRA